MEGGLRSASCRALLDTSTWKYCESCSTPRSKRASTHRIAGPNGSGKSTLTAFIHFEGGQNLIDPDAIARGIDPEDPSRAALQAGRLAIERSRTFLRERQDFAIETTLAGNGQLATIREAKAHGYWVFVVYVALSDPKRNVVRVSLRVAEGGHDVPEADVLRRYERSMANAPIALKLADEGIVFDNSGAEHWRVLVPRGGEIVWRAEDLPEWVQRLIVNLT
jgi:predicted ABC-type ATPase